jgi:hypothetical protein
MPTHSSVRPIEPFNPGRPRTRHTQTHAGPGASACEHYRVRRLPATLAQPPSDVGRIGGASDQPRARKQGCAGLPDRQRCWPDHATPYGSGRAAGRGAGRTASRGKLGTTPRPCPCRCGGCGASRSRCARSRGRRTGTCECLLFEPTRRLGAAARGTTRPSTWRSLHCLRARCTRRCRSRCCICERASRSGGGGTGPTPS